MAKIEDGISGHDIKIVASAEAGCAYWESIAGALKLSQRTGLLIYQWWTYSCLLPIAFQMILQYLLPLTPAVFFILFALADGEKHGYAIMQAVSRISVELTHNGATVLVSWDEAVKTFAERLRTKE